MVSVGDHSAVLLIAFKVARIVWQLKRVNIHQSIVYKNI